MGSSIAFAATAAAFAIQSASAGAAVSAAGLTPETKWIVDFDDQRCFAARRFRSGSGTLVFGIAPWPMYDWAKITIEKPGKVDGILPVKGRIRVGSGKTHEVTMFTAPSVNKSKTIYSFSVPGSVIEELKAEGQLSVQAWRLKADIPLASFGPVLAKLDECLPLLLENWGLPKAVQANLASYPTHATPTRLPLKSGDYPASALSRGAVGGVEVLLNVGVDGKASDCRVIRSSGHKDLDEATCEKLLVRTRFHPARDKAGKTVASPYFMNVNWIIP
jgi:TonB family protein